MNFAKTFFNSIDPDISGRLVSRREATASLGKLGAGLAVASTVPLTLGLLSKATFAKGDMPQDVNSVLNFALTLEYLESTYYTMGVQASGLIPSSDMTIFTQIQKHENAHVALLKSVLGSNAVASPQFDFTAKGTFPDVFTNYQTFIALSQAFEDTGVRAYKGQAPNLMSNGDVLQTALQIHSVEARHASEVRRLRGEKGWITGAQTTLPAPAQPVYQGEDNVVQAGVDITTLGISFNAATEAFDEPLTMAQVLAIASLFIK